MRLTVCLGDIRAVALRRHTQRISPDGLTVSGWKNMQNGTWKKGNKVVKDDDMQVVNGVLQPKKTPKF